jgi:spoIIIJ-associated protein
MDKAQKFSKEVIENLLKHLQITAEVGFDGELLKISGDDLGSLIGNKGSVISALEMVTYVAGRKKFDDFTGVKIDVNDYRKLREADLQDLAKQSAQDALSSGEPQRHYNLTAFERRIIHTYINENYENLVTFSVGEGFERVLVISKAPE